jgi:hypothetical protein
MIPNATELCGTDAWLPFGKLWQMISNQETCKLTSLIRRLVLSDHPIQPSEYIALHTRLVVQRCSRTSMPW